MYKPFRILAFALIVCLLSFKGVDYRDAHAPVDKRVDNLMSRMSIEEKVEQLQSQLVFLHQYDKRNFKVGNTRNIGHFLHIGKTELVPASQCAEAINNDTRKSIEANRWGIPVMQHGEALHGAQWGNATCFPQSIGMAACFDDEFYFRVGQVVAKELRAVGVRQVLAPNVNISRDPRWGRTEESFGEDVLLVSRMGVAYTKALEQGGVIATPKHYVDNYGDAGHDSYASANSWRVLREVFLEPFRACVEEGGARSIMAAYTAIDGIPCSNNEVLLNDILHKEWNFKGFVVSDYGGVHGVFSDHHLAKDHAEAQAMSLKAGMDVELRDGYAHLMTLLKDGRITEKLIDRSLRRVLTCKFELGLFDEPFVDAAKADEIVRCSAHKELALEAARKIMTLLKNDNQTLPLSDKSLKRIGVFGPAANVLSLGDYSGAYGGWKGDGVTPYQGLKQRLQGKAEVVLYESDSNPATLARTCDAVVYFAAIHEGEGMDRSQLALPAQKITVNHDKAKVIDEDKKLTIEIDQEKFIRDLAATGVKTIVVLQNGSVIDMRSWVNDVDAILEAWYPGEQGGTAIAEALLGDVNPGGRLPITWARHAGQLPIYYSIKPSGRGYRYNDDDGKPLFPFGYGLSYTTFEYTDLILPEKAAKGEDITVKVTVKNTGNREGDEVVQLYLHGEQSSVVRPLKELKAFRRVMLKAGESRQIELSLPYRSFGLWNKDLKFTVEPATFSVWVGKNAENVLLEKKIKVE
ncbi:MAG: glycoside hydrolase family 3 C-terminal domain-containing protein [Bacteroidales bacterium]|jgi:beta-glucosidase|nr:glycoside hydrolase family 3 C-terminal domain-containing protein [Bacteroidales bacterium]